MDISPKHSDLAALFSLVTNAQLRCEARNHGTQFDRHKH